MSPPIKLSGFSADPYLSQLKNAQLYVVGGAVRDEILGLPCIDRDWVIVGATVEEFVALGFTPVGADFPVFLHPTTKEEYALARTERKNGHGYKGFVFHASAEVTLEEDLLRRDFTINAMAMNEKGEVTDPYGGLADLQSKVMRHVSEAFEEDPLRVLRLARFLARFVDFEVHPDTVALCQKLVDNGELAYLVPERVGVELGKGLGEAQPARMWSFLSKLNAFAFMGGGEALRKAVANFTQAKVFDGLSTDHRWALFMGLTLSLDEIDSLAESLRLPGAVRDLAQVVRQLVAVSTEGCLSPSLLVEFFAQVDIYRKPDRLREALELTQSVLANSQLAQAVDSGVCQVLDRRFKNSLRAHMQQSDAELAEFGPQTVVEQFKRQWVGQILDTIQS